MQATASRPPQARPYRTSSSQPRTYSRRASAVNVGDMERWLSLVGGGALGLYGLSRRGLGGWALAAAGGALVYRGITGHCSVYQTLGVSTAEHHGPATSVAADHGVKIEESVTINKPVAELYRFWRDFENLGRFMEHLESVRVEGNRSHWIACGPLGTRFEWDAEIITERPNELIGWRSLPGSEIDTAGSVHFRALPGRGTEVRVILKYDPPAGKVGAAVARLFGQSPQAQVREDLRRLKQYMETGEMPTTAGQPRGSCGR